HVFQGRARLIQRAFDLAKDIHGLQKGIANVNDLTLLVGGGCSRHSDPVTDPHRAGIASDCFPFTALRNIFARHRRSVDTKKTASSDGFYPDEAHSSEDYKKSRVRQVLPASAKLPSWSGTFQHGRCARRCVPRTGLAVPGSG